MAIRGIQRRLFLILAVASALVALASIVAILAMTDIRTKFETVSARQLPETTAALRLAQIGERLQGRAPALIAAADEGQRAREMQRISDDLNALRREVGLLQAAESRETALIEQISASAASLHENLSALGEYVASRAMLARRMQQEVARVFTFQDDIRQTLGPSILAITAAVNRGLVGVATDVNTEPPHPPRRDVTSQTFIAAVTAQKPLLEGERLTQAAANSLLIATEVRTPAELNAVHDRFRRSIEEWQALLPEMPDGLRSPLRGPVAGLVDEVSGTGSIFALRSAELQALARAEALITDNRRLADEMSTEVDRLVASASVTVGRAAHAIDATIADHAILLAGLSVASIITAVLISYFFVIRDLGVSMRGITAAMVQLARGEHETSFPATDRPDEIGDLARAFVVFRDNARRMEKLDEQLAEKSNLLVATFDNMNDGFSVHGAEGQLLAWNRQFVLLYDLPGDLLVPGTPAEKMRRLVVERGIRFRTSAGIPMEAPIQLAERVLAAQCFEAHLASGRIIELRSNPVPSGGFVTIHTDVTERKAAELQLRHAHKMEVVGQLTGGLAHDFNNLLAVIQGNLHLLQDSLAGQQDLRERATRALAAGERAAMQIERLLAFSRRQKLRPEIVDVAALIGGILDLLECSVGARITIHTELEETLPRVFVDPGQLENALLNLALNARDAMDGSGTLTIAARTRVPITPQPDRATTPDARQSVEVLVHDNGCGMPANIVERVIEPFFTTKAPGKGSGLGLSMVYGFVQQSGGDFRIESVPGSGTSIAFTLPVADLLVTAAPVIEVNSPGRRPTADRRWSAGTPEGAILVVEDDALLLETVAMQLRRLGYRVFTATDADHALACLRGNPDISLLYTDVVLGCGENGFVLAQRAQAIAPTLELVFTSAERPELLDATTDALNAVEILRKPVPPNLLAAAMARHFSKPADQIDSTTVSNT
ncbi:MAG: PAS-domain containing protein [Rhodospirillales bacterium]|nr:PAS-domain containing protein [Rhodospirillales bacterium]